MILRFCLLVTVPGRVADARAVLRVDVRGRAERGRLAPGLHGDLDMAYRHPRHP